MYVMVRGDTYQGDGDRYQGDEEVVMAKVIMLKIKDMG